MTTFSRGITAVRRKKIKTLIMFLIMSVIFSGIAGGLSVNKAMNSMKKKVDKSINSSFSVEGRKEAFSQKDADKLLKLDSVRGHNYQFNYVATTDKKLVENRNKNIDIGDAAKGHQEAGINGISDSSAYPQFSSKAFELVKGKHIGTGSRRAALIHEVFAKKNHLKPGDKFEIRSGEKKITLKVVGIFSGNDKGQGVLPSEMVENNIFTDLKSAQALNLKKGKPEISKAWYFTKNPKVVNEVVKKAKMQNLPWGKLSIRNESEASKGVVSSLENVEKIIKVFMIGMGITSILILSFVLIFWIRSRINEIGILVSIGISKANVMRQMIMELFVIGTASLVASFAAGKFIAERLSSIFISVSGGAHDGISSKNLMDNALSGGEYALVCLVGILVILISVSIAYAPIAVQKPKEILSKMS